jgi:hypothetical protein
MIVGHLVGGPLDTLIELGLPLALFGVLWWWSARGERKKGQKRDGKDTEDRSR